MSELPACPKCDSPYTYQDGSLFICPECAHEWTALSDNEDAGETIRDSNGAELKDGDTVTVIKDLKIKGTNSVVKIGTKVKNIKIVGGDHDIDCKIPDIGPMALKSQFVKKIPD